MTEKMSVFHHLLLCSAILVSVKGIKIDRTLTMKVKSFQTDAGLKFELGMKSVGFAVSGDVGMSGRLIGGSFGAGIGHWKKEKVEEECEQDEKPKETMVAPTEAPAEEETTTIKATTTTTTTEAPTTTTTTTTEAPTTTTRAPDKCNYEGVEILEDCSCGWNGYNASDLTHGSTTNLEKHPWLVAIYNPKAKRPWGTCSGTLLKLDAVITTAACVDGVQSEIKVRTADGCERPIANVSVYDTYKKSEKYHNDIAIIKLVTPLKCTKLSYNICLPRAILGFGKEGTTMYTAGFEDEESIQEGTVKIIGENECGKESDSARFCTEDEDKTVCRGAMGGPGIQQGTDGYWRIVGVQVGEPDQDCSEEGYTSFTKVQDYSKFVVSRIK